MQWFFDGLGTQLLSILIGLLVGGVAGYQIGIRKKIKQKQVSGDESNQIQIGDMSDSIIGKKKEKIYANTTVRQSQKAGEKANQYQVGVKQRDE